MWHGCRWSEKCHFVNDISQLPYQQYPDNFDKFNVWTVWTYRLANKWTMRIERVVVLFISMRYEKQILIYSFSIWKDLVLQYVSNYVSFYYPQRVTAMFMAKFLTFMIRFAWLYSNYFKRLTNLHLHEEVSPILGGKQGLGIICSFLNDITFTYF